MRAKFFATLVFLITLVLLTACALAGATLSTPSGGDTEAAAIVFIPLSPNSSYYTSLAQTFNAEHPTIRVQIRDPDDVLSPTDDPLSTDTVRLLASSADVFLTTELDPAMLSASGAVKDVQPILSQHPEFATDDFFPGLLTRLESGSGLWGIPAGVRPRVMFYNRTLFDAAEVDEPRLDWTWDDFLTKALALTDRDAGIWGFAEQGRHDSVGAFVYQHGSTLVEEGGPFNIKGSEAAPSFNNPLAVEALNWYADLARGHQVMPDPDSPDAPQVGSPGLTGRAAMWIGLPSQHHGTDTCVVPLPRDRRSAAMATIPAYYMSAGTTYPEAAWQWIDFLTRHPPEPQWLPVRRSVLNSRGYRSKVDDDLYSAYVYILEHLSTHPWPGRYPWFTEAYYWLTTEGLPAVMRSESDAQDVLAEAQTRASAALDELPRPNSAGSVVARPSPVPPTAAHLTFLNWTDQDPYRELAHVYQQKYPNVVVEVREFASDAEYPPNRLAAEADVFPAPSGFELDAVKEQWLNLQPLVESDPDVDLDDFYPQGLDAYRRQGDLWALPTEMDAQMLFYNKALFDAAGVDAPQPEWTWDDFLKAADQLTQGRGVSKQWGFVTLARGWETLPLVLAAQQGGSLVNDRVAPTRATLNDPMLVSALRWYADLSQVYGVMPPPTVHFADWEKMEALVSQGRAAMWITSVGSRYWKEMDIDLGVVPLPASADGGRPATMYTVLGYGISAQTPYVREAWHWLTFLAQQPNATRGLPASRSVAEQAAFPRVSLGLQPEVRKAYQLTLDSYTDASYDTVRAQTPWFDAVYRLYRHAVKQTFEEGTDPAETLGNAQAVAEAYLACLELRDEPADESVRELCEEEVGVPAPIVWYEE